MKDKNITFILLKILDKIQEYNENARKIEESITTICKEEGTFLHENFADFWGKIAFRGILISRFEQKIRISQHFNFAVQAKNEKSK